MGKKIIKIKIGEKFVYARLIGMSLVFSLLVTTLTVPLFFGLMFFTGLSAELSDFYWNLLMVFIGALGASGITLYITDKDSFVESKIVEGELQ